MTFRTSGLPGGEGFLGEKCDVLQGFGGEMLRTSELGEKCDVL